MLFAVFKSLCRAEEIEIKHWSLDLVLQRSASYRWNHPFLSKTAMMNSLVISVSLMAEKQNFFLPDYISRYGDILNSLGPLRISFARWAYLFTDKHNNPRTRE